jgi:anaerobic dimethyl sulfoxide reductase subunit B (iron-sulfur subunit)
MSTSLTEPGANYGFVFFQTMCNGCKACQIACKDKHDLPLGVNWRRVVEYTGGTWQQEGRACQLFCVSGLDS